jgi:hypothetical protein
MLVLVAGCATVPKPTEQAISSQAAIRAAEEVGARSTPDAALHLQLAQEQARAAETLMHEGDYKRARSLLLRSQADAELAISLAREQEMRSEAQQVLDRLRQLQMQTGQEKGS